MTSGMPSLLDSIFGKQNLEGISLEEIHAVLAEFPSFNAAHFLLSKKLKLENDPAYPEQTMKTALYFNNPVWLQSLLEEDQDLPASADDKTAWAYEKEYEDAQPAIAVNEEYAKDEEFVPTINQEYEELQSTGTINEEYTESAEIQPAIHDQPSTINEQPPLSESVIPIEYAEPAINHQPSAISEAEGELQTPESINQEYAESAETQPAVYDQPPLSESITPEYIEPAISHQPSAISEAEEESQTPEPISQEHTESAETQPAVYDQPPLSEPTIHHPPSTINEEPSLIARHSPVPFDAKKAESIVFEPYHMIDYFASQGIKLIIEDHPEDSFGRQLKSFTDWLKVMKRLPAHQAGEKADERETERIRRFAANSIEERDILTETMAEVLAKQGMYENAIALYQKLSLIYPPKSAYFASRIEQLKASLS